MLKRLSVVFLLFCIFLLESCKKSKVISFSNKLHIDKKVDKKDDIFSPVSDIEAKKIVGSFSNNDKNDFSRSQDLHEKLLTNKQLRELRDIARQKEAKLSDVPIPINVEPIESFFNNTISPDNTVILGYRSSMPMNNICMFYRQEMERLGWRNIAEFDGCEKLLNFQKPGKFCSVSIRTRTGSCDSEISQEPINIILFIQRL